MKRALNYSRVYVIVHVAASLLIFLRNVSFMWSLETLDLGQIALMQTVIMFVGFCHFGVITGAFLQYAKASQAERKELVDNSVALAFWGCWVALLVGVVGAFNLQGSTYLLPQVLLLGCVAGALTLTGNLLNNFLVASQKLFLSNVANVIAMVVSLIAASATFQFGLTAALLAMLVHPLVLVLTILILCPELRPSGVVMRRMVIAHAFRIGFPGFCSGLFLLLLYQVERWSIGLILGPELLGEYYLVLMYTAFFTLVPMAIQNVRTPVAVRHFHNAEHAALRVLLLRHLRDLGLYIAVAAVLTLGILQPLVALVLPEFTQQVVLVYYILPAMALLVLQDVPALYFFARTQMRAIMVASLIGLGVYCAAFTMMWISGDLSLTAFTLLRGIGMATGLCILIIFLVVVSRRHRSAASDIGG